MSNPDFELNQAGVDEFLRSTGLRLEMVKVGDKLLQRVRRNSHGLFRAKLGRTGAKNETIDGKQSVVVDVYTDDWFAHLYEFGSATNKPYAPMRRAAESMGFKVER
jgi:hypothetical protein